jgi:CheY-like chemotaxis protein
VGQRILMVDDEPQLLDGLRRVLHGSYRLVTATSGPQGLALQCEALAAGDPFAVIVSDMMMPGMNGAQFLTAARAVDQDAVRVILSGQADLTSTIAAVNDADLFRFLTKPCGPRDLTKALDAALAHHRLVLAERELLERTLRGAVDVLTELLSLASPEAFSRTARVRDLCQAVADELGLAEDWRLRLAAVLSQIGCIAVPPQVLHRIESNSDAVTGQDRQLYLAHPRLARQLLERIPRLEEVAAWVGDQPLSADTPPPAGAGRAQLVLCAVTAFLGGYGRTGSAGKGVKELQAAGHYPSELLMALLHASAALDGAGVLRELPVHRVRAGMILRQDVRTTTGMVLVRGGERVSAALLTRLENFAATVGVVEPVVVLDPH